MARRISREDGDSMSIKVYNPLTVDSTRSMIDLKALIGSLLTARYRPRAEP